jgi:hypothetical protein
MARAGVASRSRDALTHLRAAEAHRASVLTWAKEQATHRRQVLT